MLSAEQKRGPRAEVCVARKRLRGGAEACARPAPPAPAASGLPGSRFPGWKGVLAGVRFSISGCSSHVDTPGVASFSPGALGLPNLTAPTSACLARGEPRPVAGRVLLVWIRAFSSRSESKLCLLHWVTQRKVRGYSAQNPAFTSPDI